MATKTERTLKTRPATQEEIRKGYAVFPEAGPIPEFVKPALLVRVCANCRFLDQHRCCHANPPTVFGSGMTLRPIIDEPDKDFCGKWEAK